MGVIIVNVEPYEVIEQAKDAYQTMFLTFLNAVCKVKSEMPAKASVQKLLKKTLVVISKSIIPKLKNPLLLADFLLSCLDDTTDLSNQIFALKGLFLLLQHYSLDCPQYYMKLYGLLLPQYVDRGDDRPKSVRSIFSAGIDHESKARLLRLLDLSLRSASLPSKLVAAYIKRISRLIVNHGVVQAPSDIMFLVGLIANLLKRHPRCMRLLHRKKTSMSLGLHLTIDPFRD
jgi:U3 small nucleolar RNA-associated protein 19